MNTEEVVTGRRIVGRWVEHQCETFGFEADAVVLNGPDSKVRVLATGASPCSS